MTECECGDCHHLLGWKLSSSSDRAALDLVDGMGPFEGHGPHYSRRSPGSKTFTGVGREVVLVHESGLAVWAVVFQRTPARKGEGSSRGRTGAKHLTPYVWRNMLFRRLPGAPLASDLIRTATEATYRMWLTKYGSLPDCRLRTEVKISAVTSTNPGYCYKCAGFVVDRVVRGKLYLWAPSMWGSDD